MTGARLLVAGPNLTIDRTGTIVALRAGEVLRTRAVAVTPGGKGVNVVRAATRLGARARLVGFVAGRLGSAAAAMLTDEGIELTAISVPGELRSTAVLTDDEGRVTVINEPGPPIDAADWASYEQAVAERLPDVDVLVCSGSVPPGAPRDAFGRLVGIARAARVPSVVDATGDLLTAALEARPDVATPNLAEAEGLRGLPVREDVDVDPASARRRALDAARLVVAGGARAAVVTAGAAGAALAARDGLAWVDAPVVQVRNPIGAGDTFAGGLAVALANRADLGAAVVAGVAAAAAGVEDTLAGSLDPVRVAQLVDGLRLERVRPDPAPPGG